MSRDVLVTLLESVVFFDVMKIIPSDCEGTLHFKTLDDTCQQTTSDSDISGEGALLVNVRSIDSLTRGFDS